MDSSEGQLASGKTDDATEADGRPSSAKDTIAGSMSSTSESTRARLGGSGEHRRPMSYPPPRPLRVMKRHSGLGAAAPAQAMPAGPAVSATSSWPPSASTLLPPHKIPVRVSSATKLDANGTGDGGEEPLIESVAEPPLPGSMSSPSLGRHDGPVVGGLDVTKHRQKAPFQPRSSSSQKPGTGRSLFGGLTRLTTAVSQPLRGSIRSVAGLSPTTQKRLPFNVETVLAQQQQNSGRSFTAGANAGSKRPWSSIPTRSVTEPGAAAKARLSLAPETKDTTASCSPTSADDTIGVKVAAGPDRDAKSSKKGFRHDLEKLADLGKKKSLGLFRANDPNFRPFRGWHLRRSSHHKRGSSASSHDENALKSRSTTVSSSGTTATVRKASRSGGDEETSADGDDDGVNVEPAAFSMDGSQSLTAFQDRPTRPQPMPVLAPYIDIVPQVEALETNAEGELMVAVNVVAGCVLPQADDETAIPTGHPLDVIICVQVGPWNTEAAVVACQEVAMTLVHTLDGDIDRVALVENGSSDIFFRDEMCFLRAKLGPIDVDQMSKAVSGIRRPLSLLQPPLGVSCDAVRFCVDVLRLRALGPGAQDPSRPASRGGGAKAALGHIFFISSEPFVCTSPSTEAPDDVQVHFLNCSPVPWNHQAIPANGWQLHCPPYASDEEVSSCLRKTIRAARLGLLLGSLGDVTIIAHAGPRTQLMEFTGQISWHRLVPGQTVRLLAKILYSPFLVSGTVVPPGSPNSSGRPMSPEEALDELNAFLGETEEDVLYIEVQYTHSFLPPATTVTTRGAGSVKRNGPDPTWSPRTRSQSARLSAAGARDVASSTLEFQTKFIESFASCLDPVAALSMLWTVYGDGGIVDVDADSREALLLAMTIETLRWRAASAAPFTSLRHSRHSSDCSFGPYHPMSDPGEEDFYTAGLEGVDSGDESEGSDGRLHPPVSRKERTQPFGALDSIAEGSSVSSRTFIGAAHCPSPPPRLGLQPIPGAWAEEPETLSLPPPVVGSDEYTNKQHKQPEEVDEDGACEVRLQLCRTKRGYIGDSASASPPVATSSTPTFDGDLNMSTTPGADSSQNVFPPNRLHDAPWPKFPNTFPAGMEHDNVAAVAAGMMQTTAPASAYRPYDYENAQFLQDAVPIKADTRGNIDDNQTGGMCDNTMSSDITTGDDDPRINRDSAISLDNQSDAHSSVYLLSREAAVILSNDPTTSDAYLFTTPGSTSRPIPASLPKTTAVTTATTTTAGTATVATTANTNTHMIPLNATSLVSEMAQQAIQNKRSVGTDSLWSLAMGAMDAAGWQDEKTTGLQSGVESSLGGGLDDGGHGGAYDSAQDDAAQAAGESNRLESNEDGSNNDGRRYGVYDQVRGVQRQQHDGSNNDGRRYGVHYKVQQQRQHYDGSNDDSRRHGVHYPVLQQQHQQQRQQQQEQQQHRRWLTYRGRDVAGPPWL